MRFARSIRLRLSLATAFQSVRLGKPYAADFLPAGVSISEPVCGKIPIHNSEPAQAGIGYW